MLEIARGKVVATVVIASLAIGSVHAQQASFDSFAVPAGGAPHDVASAPDGGAVWFTAQAKGAAGRLDPRSGKTDSIPLGEGSAPHGVIVGPDRAAWITDGGLNTAVFDKRGHLWFTGQSGIDGELDPASGRMRVFGSDPLTHSDKRAGHFLNVTRQTAVFQPSTE